MEQETLHAIITLSVLAVTIIFFINGKFRTDAVAGCALLVLLVTGVLEPDDAFSGFGNSIIPTVIGVFMIGGAIVRSGLAMVMGEVIMRIGGNNANVLFILLMLITAAIGSLVSNVGTVAIMMPIVVSMTISLKVSPSRFLMPLAFMSAIGGMLTLIGNPSNMVVNDAYVKAGYKSLTLFSFLPVGLVCLVFGMFILAPATYWYLGRRKHTQDEPSGRARSLRELADKYHLARHLHTIVVPPGSPMAGQNLASLNLTGRFGMYIQEVRRVRGAQGMFGSVKEKWLSPGPQNIIEKGDTLYCQGNLEKALSMVHTYGLMLQETKLVSRDDDKYHFDLLGICELVLMSSSQLVGRTVEASGLRGRFGLSVLGIQRRNDLIMEDVKNQELQGGDALLVQGLWKDISRLDEFTDDWVVVGQPKELAKTSLRKEKIPLVATVVVLMAAAMATGFLPTVTAVLLAVIALALGGCFRNIEEAYSFISWETVIMLGCMLPIAIAMQKNGLTSLAALHITELGRIYGPLAALAVIYLICSGLNIAISTTPVALLGAPLAIQVAHDLACNPLPFVFCVAVASCFSFASPFAMPANALVMSAGRYTFMDYLKIGLPLQLLAAAIMIPVLPLLFPF